jgi:hypothetical protein
LELVFSDVWGPAPTSVGKYNYYVSFIDDFSKFTWIYLIRHKSEVFQRFHEFQNLVERMFDTKIKTMQTDWGGEYQKLNSFFQRISISHHVSCPHTHQQNGSAERKHRHIVEVGLSLLAHASIPLKFWDEAFLTATYLINRLPSHTINNETPLARLLHTDPDYSTLRTFGCACWPNLRPYNNRKLQFRSKQCVFLGYSNQHKGFKCIDVAEGRVYISRDVVFDEDVYPFSALHPNAGARLRSEVLLLPETLRNFSYGDEITSTFSGSNSPANTTDEAVYTDTSPQDVLQESQANPASNAHDFMQPGVHLPVLADAEHEADSPAADRPDSASDQPPDQLPGARAPASPPRSTPGAASTQLGARLSPAATRPLLSLRATGRQRQRRQDPSWIRWIRRRPDRLRQQAHLRQGPDLLRLR